MTCMCATNVGHGLEGPVRRWVIAGDGTRGVPGRATEPCRESNDPGRLTARVGNHGWFGGP